MEFEEASDDSPSLVQARANLEAAMKYLNAAPVGSAEAKIILNDIEELHAAISHIKDQLKKPKVNSHGYNEELIRTCQEICAPGKGILAVDESNMTIGKRFEALGVENSHDNKLTEN